MPYPSHSVQVDIRSDASNELVDRVGFWWAEQTRQKLRLADVGARDVPRLAETARRWFRSTWASEQATRKRNFPIEAITVRFFNRRGGQGVVLATVDVLTGQYKIRT